MSCEKSWLVKLTAVTAICFCLMSTLKGQSNVHPWAPAPELIFTNTVGFHYAYVDGQSYLGFDQQMIWDNQALQAELELTRDQRRELLDMKLDYDERAGQYHVKIKKANAKILNLGNGGHNLNEDAKKELLSLHKEFVKMRKEAMEQIDKVLLPHQRELKVQLAVKRFIGQGFFQILANPSIQRQFKFDNETKQRFAKKRKELEARLQAEMAELVRTAHDEILAELDGDARDMAEKLLDQYEYLERAKDLELLLYDRFFMKPRRAKDDEN